jgi:quercetin dioxygenase-like cupin family protein
VIIRRRDEVASVPSRRAGIEERRLLGPEQSAQQNHVICEAAPGASVEEHVVANSESFHVLEGRLEIFGPGFRTVLEAGDFVYFEPGAAHGMTALARSRYLVVFAPAGKPRAVSR